MQPDVNYSDLDVAHTIIRDTLQQCDTWIQTMLEQRELRVFWFQFESMETQESVLLSLHHNILLGQSVKEEQKEELILSLVRSALRGEEPRDSLHQKTRHIPHLWDELDRIEKKYAPQEKKGNEEEEQKQEEEQKEYIVIFSTPVQREPGMSRRDFFMTINCKEQERNQRLYDALAQQGGLYVLLDAYKTKLESKSWLPAPHLLLVLRNELVRTSCRQCHAPLEKRMRCSKCKVARYCNVTCQRKNWVIHKSLCAVEKDILQRCATLVETDQQQQQ